MTTTLSIGVPVYNHGKYLRLTILSLLSQTVEPNEIVVSNNHSTDETEDVLGEFEGRIRIIKPPCHLPATDHFNFLGNNLQSEWICFMGADDIAKPNFVQTLLAGTDLTSNAILVRSGFDIIDGCGYVLCQQRLLSVKSIVSPPETFVEQINTPFGKGMLYSSIIKREIFEMVGGFPKEFKLTADWGLYAAISPYGDFIYRPGIVSQKREGYRPGLTNARTINVLKDWLLMYTEYFPRIAYGFESIHRNRLQKQIKRAACRDFVNALSHASNHLDIYERSDSFDTLAKWSDLVEDHGALLVKFKAGARIQRSESLFYVRAKAALRPVLSRILEYVRL